MPKQPGGVSRIKRVECLLDVIKRWGRLDKNEIDQKVAVSLNVSIDEIQRALYRDLSELTENGQLLMFGETSSGDIIKDIDKAEHKNFKSFWCLPENSPFEIMGLSKLRQYDGDFYSNELIYKSFKISELTSLNLDKIKNALIFSLGIKTLALIYDPEITPFSILVTRKGSENSSFYPEIFSKLGSRTAILSLPEEKISGIKKGNILGHAVLSFKGKGVLNILDNSSTNGTYVKTLEDQHIQKVLLEHINSTKTRDEKVNPVLNEQVHSMEFTTLEPQKGADFNHSVEILCSSYYKIFAVQKFANI